MASYLVSAIGIPVYLHYCGGELEDVSYVLRKINCCGSEDENESGMDGGCCQDKNVILRISQDFTLKILSNYSFVKAVCNIFDLPAFHLNEAFNITSSFISAYKDFPPPKLQNDLLIFNSVLRI